MIAITGASGFLGGAIAKELYTQNRPVLACTRPASNRATLNALGIPTTSIDLLDAHSLKDKFNDADTVIHAAGMLGKTGTPAAKYHQIHVGGTRRLLDELIRAGRNQRFVYISSPGVLGPIPNQAHADESYPRNPSNDYERSKAEAEALVQTYTDKLDIVIVRPEFIYGPGDLHVLGLFQSIQKGQFFYINNGKHYCHPTYIDDAVNGIILALDKGKSGEIYHITGEKPLSFKSLAKTIAKELNVEPPKFSVSREIMLVGATVGEAILGEKVPLGRDGVKFFSEDRRFSWEKAQDHLGYNPQISITRGIKNTIDWYKQHGYL